ncbi:dehydrogenase/reductase SDR family member FEY-like protein [Tanacetum coccineum]
MTSSSSSETDAPVPATETSPATKVKKEALGWMEWIRGWLYLFYEMLFQRIMASHLENPLPLPPLDDVTCVITGSTSGIGRETARILACFVHMGPNRGLVLEYEEFGGGHVFYGNGFHCKVVESETIQIRE